MKSRVLQLSKSILRSVVVLPLALVVLLPTATPGQAQGFFQSLFGGGQPSRPRMMPPRRSRYMPQSQSVPWWQQGRHSQQRRSRHYTAMCVRMCDGFYWPMSNRATRGKFYNLAQRCENSCNGEAKLFYMPSHSSDVKRMTDLSGRAYEHINTAFLYRKKLVKSCTCKPMPWSYSARAKHRQYAAEELQQQLRVKQRERQRQAALKRQNEAKNAQNHALERSDDMHAARKRNGRTIIERVDDADSAQQRDDESWDVAREDAAPAHGDNTVSDDFDARAAQALAAQRIAKRAEARRQIRQQRARRYSAMKQRRLKPKPKWNTGFGGGKAGKVWPGDRPRPRVRRHTRRRYR